MLSVDDALARVVSDLAPSDMETVALEDGHGRILAEDVSAKITQPPFDASAMDGYAVRAEDVTEVPCSLSIVGEAAAGHPWEGTVGADQAVRIFTGGAVPAGADTIIIQEDTARDGDSVTVNEGVKRGTFVRPRGFDFAEGDVLLKPGRRLNARDLTLAAAMNVTSFSVRRKPVVALLATGDELVMPGDDPKPGQIVSSIPYGLAELIRAAGGDPLRLGIAKDTEESLAEHIAEARDADILVTIGGASVGEHDLVQTALKAAGMSLDFWRIAMRPGKPLMFGQMGAQRVLGVPGNPVSALVCSRIFLVPMIDCLLGLNRADAPKRTAILAGPLEQNGPRQHYMRATIELGPDGETRVSPVRSQDSSLMAPLSQADCLIVRMPDAPAASDGERVEILPLDF
ncbi:MAG: gephyrin-like molybdotransferase Glp [Pseudomonadota bacterium]